MVEFSAKVAGWTTFFDEDGDGRLFHDDGGMDDAFFREGAG